MITQEQLVGQLELLKVDRAQDPDEVSPGNLKDVPKETGRLKNGAGSCAGTRCLHEILRIFRNQATNRQACVAQLSIDL